MKTEKSNKLRGTVLFTVVCVMALLIIFLTGTLALATASSNRAHKSYSSSQANYTAKTAITGFTRALSTEKNVRDVIVNLGVNSNPAVIHPEIKITSGGNEDRSMGLVGYWDNNGDWVNNRITVERETEQDPARPTDPNARILKSQWMYDETKGKWVEAQRVKITATARVGKEESTVTAYLSKKPAGTIKPPSQNGSGGIKGLNAIGDGNFKNGGRYTGGYGLGLSTSGYRRLADGNWERIQYELLNSVELDTTLSFINADLYVTSGTFGINVNNSPEAPVSQTVVNGNMFVKNDSFVMIDYEMTSDFTQKEVPYLYVDGALGFASQCGIVTVEEREPYSHTSSAVAPYNVFCGTINANTNNYLIHGDLYLMDDTSTGKKYELKGENGAKIEVTAGENTFGGTNSSQLYKWAYDAVNRTKEQHESFGGSIYCNGNLTLGGGEIDGDVKVKGDLVIKDNTHVHGNVVVAGTFSGGGKLTVDGQLIANERGGYSESGNNNSAPPTYSSRDNHYHGPEEYRDGDWSALNIIEYPERSMLEWETGGKHQSKTTYQPTDILGNDTNTWEPIYYYYADDYCPGITLVKDNEGNIEYKYPDEEYDPDSYAEVKSVDEIIEDLINTDTATRDPDTLNVIEKWLKVDEGVKIAERRDLEKKFNVKIVVVKDAADQPKLDGDGNVIFRETSMRADKKSVLFDPNTNSILEDAEVPHYTKADYNGNDTGIDVGSVKKTYYRDNDGKEVSETVALAPPPDPGPTSAGDKYKKYNGEETYPENMTREKIYGTRTGTEYEGKFNPPTDNNTKIIKNIQEVRADLGLDPTTGGWEKYPESIENEDDRKKAERVAMENGVKKDTSVFDGDVIVDSCTLKGTFDNKTITINPQGKDIWVILEDYTFSNGGNILVDRFYTKPGDTTPTECGKVQFFIKGKLEANGSGGIVNKKIVDNSPLVINMASTPRLNTDFGMEFYGASDSSILLNNYFTLTGTFKCPYTDFEAKNHGYYQVKYTDEYGIDWANKSTGQTRGADQTGGKPTIIGNALFRNIIDTQNEFGLFYTETGQNNSGNGNNNNNPIVPIVDPDGDYWTFEFYSAT